MQETLHLGTIGRTRVGLNWSVVVIVVLIAVGLALGVFPVTAPGFTAAAYWLVALLSAALFLTGLLGHELSHALVARRRGVVVDGIVLWALGGVANLKDDAPDARSELRIAIAGPLASVGLAAAFGLVALGLSAIGASSLAVAALWWIAEMNALLAVFNLLPAYPLDGGRVLRAGLWRHWGDRLRATNAAARVGAFFGAALIGLGVVAFVLLPAYSLSGLWIALIGWFVLGASRRERGAVLLRSALDGISVGDVMQPVTVVAPAYATLENLIDQYFRPDRLDRCPLVDFNGEMAGLLTWDQIGRVGPEHLGSTRASEVAWAMASLAQTTSASALCTVVSQLSSVPSHCGLVFEDGRLIGTLTPADIDRALRSPGLFRGRSQPDIVTTPSG